VVITSVPEHATVVGVLGRVVSVRNPDTDTMERLEKLEQRLDALERRRPQMKGNNGEDI
jgi:serine acetyltransferase